MEGDFDERPGNCKTPRYWIEALAGKSGVTWRNCPVRAVWPVNPAKRLNARKIF
ncbi:hypothetical protein [Pseudomonas putida]|uniref:hypothetical protein n=1 Tax=Pseudomonas TaxID=286 RepID=UPI00130D9405|nr:hypothetical protein [Pseudomonas putida]